MPKLDRVHLSLYLCGVCTGVSGLAALLAAIRGQWGVLLFWFTVGFPALTVMTIAAISRLEKQKEQSNAPQNPYPPRKTY